MKPDDLDQILLGDRKIAPGESFTANVMARIEKEAATECSIPFLRLGLIVCLLAISIPVILFFPVDAFVRVMTALSYDLGSWILDAPKLALQPEMLAISASLLGTWLLVWFSLRLAGASR